MCVNNWDHHCFWLNTCINDKNKKAFNFFYWTFIVDVFINTAIICFSNLFNKISFKCFNFFINLDYFVSLIEPDIFEIYFFSLFSNEQKPSKDDIASYKIIWHITFTIFFYSIIYTILYIIVYKIFFFFLIDFSFKIHLKIN